MNRRKFIQISSVCAAFAFSPAIALAQGEKSPFRRVYAKTDLIKNPPLPSGKRSSGGMDYFRLDDNPKGVLLKFRKFSHQLSGLKSPSIKLSLGNAIENRGSFALFVRSAKDGRIFSRLDAVNLFGFQVVRFNVPVSEIAEIEEYGLVITCSPIEVKDAVITKGEPLCFFAESAVEKIEAMAPHLLLYDADYDVNAAFYENLCSINSILPFGWMSGCQTEGLRELSEAGDLSASAALAAHLDFFLDDDKGVVFNNPRSELCENGNFDSIEDFLPFVAIGKLYPNHKSLNMFLNWAMPKIRLLGNKSPQQRFLSTEGCYTYAYPLMQVAINRNDASLAQIALNEICVRIDRLVDSGGGIHQKAREGEKPSMRNWGRGIAWFMLGIVQTMRALENSRLKSENLKGKEKILKTIADSSNHIKKFQQPDGSWFCFIDDPKTYPESSGSVGIAAAFALASEAGFIDPSYMLCSEKTLEWFFHRDNIEPDGFSKNVTQSNRLGDAFQRSGYRVIMPISSGLAAQIIAVKRRAAKQSNAKA